MITGQYIKEEKTNKETIALVKEKMKKDSKENSTN